MLTYCFKCKQDTEIVDSKMLKTKSGRTMLSSICAVCGSKKSRFLEEQEAKGLLTSLRLKNNIKGYLHYKTIFCSKVALDV